MRALLECCIMTVLKCAVIGVGHLGRYHAQKYQTLANAKLVAVCDTNRATCEAISKELQVPAFFNHRDLFGKVDAVSIAATTNAHYEIAKDCLSQGIHVLLEKPIAETVEQADELIALARHSQAKLQVGHLERFNAAHMALNNYLEQPFFIESHRLSPFTTRSADVNVVLDLMIHDIDLIQTMVKSPVVKIEAKGTSLVSPLIDVAHVRLTFQNQCIANITANRVSAKPERKTKILQPNAYITVDYHLKQLTLLKKEPCQVVFPNTPEVIQHHMTYEDSDALLEEIKAFLACIENNTTPVITGEDGRDAMLVASEITALIHHHLETVVFPLDPKKIVTTTHG